MTQPSHALSRERKRRHRGRRVLGVLGMGSVLAIGCTKFRAADCEDASCAGESAVAGSGDGGLANGGTANGGLANGGGGRGGASASGGKAGKGGNAGVGAGGNAGNATGGRNAAGMGGVAGANVAGTLGALGGLGGLALAGNGGNDSGAAGADDGGTSNADRFPASGVLDAFDAAGETLGAEWIGGIDRYVVREGELACEGFCDPIFWGDAFGVEQEVFATFVSFSASSDEVGLILKGRGTSACDIVEVFFAPTRGEVEVAACFNQSWTSLGLWEIDLQPGDQLGGRAQADGTIEVYWNGVRVGAVDASEYPFIGDEGRIGIDGIASGDAPNVWDDFGGG